MSRFYASIEGNRGPATRQGSADSGIEAHPRGWRVGVRVRGFADGDADEFHVYATSGSGGGESDRMIAVVRREPSGGIEVESKIVPALNDYEREAARFPDFESDTDEEGTFLRYIAHGKRAVATHPDPIGPETIDYETAATDTIASILHALDDNAGRSPEQARSAAGAMDGVCRGELFEVLERAWRAYVGDFEDLPTDPEPGEYGYEEPALHRDEEV